MFNLVARRGLCYVWAMSLPVIEPSRVTVMIKPVGALCNLDCHYCYYLPTKSVFDKREHRMTRETLETLFEGVLPRFEKDVTIAWQGGEPTLAGLDFFKYAIELQHKHAKPGQTIANALQTNGTLLNDDWCKFLHENKFLIGLSVDGPPQMHDHYRLSNRGKASSGDVLRGLSLLRKHRVDTNLLTVLNDRNVKHPDEVFHYLLNLGERYFQFIPAIEWEPDETSETGNRLAPFSPKAEDYGRFMMRVFDLWFERYRTTVSVRLFDAVLNRLVLGVTPYCIVDGSCHNQLTIEHDGSVFLCDHFVTKRWQVGMVGDNDWTNAFALDGGERVPLTVHKRDAEAIAVADGRDIDTSSDLAGYEADPSPSGRDLDWLEHLDGERMASFASRKQNLPKMCQQCQWKPICYGGCPKHRSTGGEMPEPSSLCEGYKLFYEHSMEKMQWLAGYLRRNEMPPPPEPARPTSKKRETRKAQQPQHAAAGVPGAVGAGPGARQGRTGRNDPCPCGSGLKYKKCCGRGA